MDKLKEMGVFLGASIFFVCMLGAVYQGILEDRNRRRQQLPPPDTSTITGMRIQYLRIIIREECERAIRNAQQVEKK